LRANRGPAATAADLVDSSVGQVPMERLRSVFDGMFDGVLLAAADGRVTYANEAMARLLATTAAGMRGRPIASYVEESLRPEFEQFLSGQRVHAGERIELRFRREDGSTLISLVAGSPITTEDGAYVGTILNVSDVTGKTAIDAQAIQNQRLEAVGQFASGVAHDFNNLLTSMRGYAELARSSLPEGDSIRGDLDQVLAGADRASAITRKLLAFTRRQILDPVVVDPATILAELAPMLGSLLGDGVGLALEVAPDHGRILVDPTQLEQVIVNLAINARDAMPLGGRVTISICDLDSDDAERPDRQLNPGPFVRISVADTGTGMDQATLIRAFDPFFTTKGPGKGTGLGLSAVSGIVAQSGGMVHVDTVLGSGSVFYVDLPRVVAAAIPPPRQPAQTIPRQSGVVLVVEDDAAVRSLARRILEAAGYTVLAAARAVPALRAVERWGAQIDALVTDIVMPGMNGLDLAARITQQMPGIGVVFISGNPDGVLDRDGELRAVGAFVAKPFTSEVLSRAVSAAVDHGRTHIRRGQDRVPAKTESGDESLIEAASPRLWIVPKPGAESGSD
jgi:PAS domain S-box-containing protein